jgi:hypothetical protein
MKMPWSKDKKEEREKGKSRADKPMTYDVFYCGEDRAFMNSVKETFSKKFGEDVRFEDESDDIHGYRVSVMFQEDKAMTYREFVTFMIEEGLGGSSLGFGMMMTGTFPGDVQLIKECLEEHQSKHDEEKKTAGEVVLS